MISLIMSSLVFYEFTNKYYILIIIRANELITRPDCLGKTPNLDEE